MTTPSNQIEIPLSKTKLFLLFAGSLVFVILGIWLIWYELTTSPYHRKRPYFGLVIGPLAIIFFGTAAYFLCKKLFDRRPGLIISDEGIFDNSGAFSIGLILWTDVLRIKEVSVGKQTFINVVVKDPLAYVARQKEPIQRRLMKMSYDMYGSPIGITSNGLQCRRKDLLELLKADFRKWKRKQNQIVNDNHIS
ncbi:STM3941 family protein [Pedobacter panaciterrae]